MREGGEVHLSVSAVGYLLALHVTVANEQDRAHVALLAEATFADQVCAGEQAAE